ncbi:MAG TPA: lamin tail domain-containing protein, partial [Candidatus Luteococcus avicola]|nr:lamin tail domain-containing protein [Candidatus Luteococcus avicola]
MFTPLRRGTRRTALIAAAGIALTAAPLAQLPALAATDHLVINEVYGGGGNSGATYTHDFVELYNGTSSAIDVTGWRLAYYSAAGNLGSSCTLTGSIVAGSHFLVQEAKGTAGTEPLPTPDATCTAAMSGTAGSVELADATGTVVDLVGYGTATRVETTAAPTPSNSRSVTRANGTDTNNNQADFTVGAPTPQNSGTSTDPTPTPDPTGTPTPTP